MDLKHALLLYSLISKNQRLADKRHPMFEKNLAMKIFVGIFIAFWAVYLFAFGILFYFIFEDTNYEAFDWINGGMIFFVTIDFFLRFGMQETPAQDIKCYKLLPISENFLLDVFLFRIGVRAYNLFWFFFLLPFGFLSVPEVYGFTGLLGYLIGWWLVFVLNSYWYLIWRTFINKSIFTIIIPVLVFAALIYFGIFHNEDNTWLFDFCLHVGRCFVNFDILSFLTIIAIIISLFFVNRYIQSQFIYSEISKSEEVTKVKTNEMSFLDRFGVVGEYVKLEIKSTIRNKVIRKQFLFGVIYMLLFSVLFAFTDVYDGVPFMKCFICMYCFACLGVMTLTNVMCMEGNYMDGLMSRKESVLSLLKAKYLFNSLLTLLPLIFAIMPMIEGKVTFVELLGCMFFTTGVVYPFLFQLAVYNNTTIHLNEKLTKSGRSTKMQTLFSSLALFVPMLVMFLLITFLSENIAGFVMFVIGLIGTIIHPLWLRNIYNRFMKRRYTNMSGFRDTRQQ
ncbi:MAG: hypothetical protein IJY78_00615 [Bacteroidaceae bacterium]|nr:hypothetical protein [Bacteroidaceae bacterium]